MKLKQWITRISKAFYTRLVSTRFFYFERTGASVNWWIWEYDINRQSKEKTPKRVAAIDYRRSYMKGYAYITISFFHYVTINIDLHRPL